MADMFLKKQNKKHLKTKLGKKLLVIFLDRRDVAGKCGM
jgi:hypothetical protein